MAEFTIDINFNLDTSGIEEAEESLATLRDTADELGDSTESIDGSGFADMSASAGETSENIKQASDSMGELGNQTEETNQKMQETADSSASIGTALVGIGGAVGLDMMISKADNVETSWNRLSLTYRDTGVSMDTLKAKTSELQDATGKSGSSIRDYFNQMGIAGITNIDLLTESFNNMSGRAYQTGSTVEQMEGALQRMVMSGNAGAKMLTRLGISNTELANAMGVSATETASAFKELTETERLEVLNKAMGDGTEANEMYKNSFAGLKEQSDIALGGLMVAIGKSILPLAIPVMQTLTNVIRGVTDVFKGLPSPVTSIFGVIGGGIVVVTTFATALGTLGYIGSSVVGGLKSLRDGFSALRGAIGTARLMVQAMQNAESVSMAIRSAWALATGTATTVEEANAVAKASAVAPTTALAIAENSLLLPILLVIGAIVGLVAILWYLYNTNEAVRQHIDNIINEFREFINIVISTGQQIYSFCANALQQFISFTDSASANISNFIRGIVGGFASLPSQITGAMSGVKDAITKPFTDAYNIVKPYIDQIGSAWNSISGIFNGFEGYEGFNGNVGYEGFGNSLNGALASSTSNSSNVTNNFNINGIIEESASEYIVGAVNNHLKKENLIRGV